MPLFSCRIARANANASPFAHTHLPFVAPRPVWLGCSRDTRPWIRCAPPGTGAVHPRDRADVVVFRLAQVQCTREIKLKVSEICSLLEVDGIRGDMVINRAARALVAMEGRDEVTLDDVKKVIGICLNHRWLLKP